MPRGRPDTAGTSRQDRKPAGNLARHELRTRRSAQQACHESMVVSQAGISGLKK